MFKAITTSFILVSFSVAHPDPVKIGNLNCALLIIDMQNDFTEANGKNPADSIQTETAIKTINKLATTFHDNGKPAIIIRNLWKNPFHGVIFGFAGKEGTWGAELNKRIQAKDAFHFSKGRPSAFSNDSLIRFLKEMEINTVFVTGVKANQCVFAALKDGQKRGFKTYAVLDGIAANDEKAKAKAFEKYERGGIESINLESIE